MTTNEQRQQEASSVMLDALKWWRDAVMSDFTVALRKGYVDEGMRKIDAAITQATGERPIWPYLHDGRELCGWSRERQAAQSSATPLGSVGK